MELEENRLAKNISEILFEDFEEISVTGGNDVNNSDDVVGPAENQRSQNHGFPPMPVTRGGGQTMIQSSPHQILTPPVHELEKQHGHTPMYGQNLMPMATMQYSHPQNMVIQHHVSTRGGLSSAIQQNNTLMYPDPPSTPRPRDTPPISNSSNLSVSAGTHYKMDQYYSHSQQMQSKAPNLMEDMSWLTQSLMQEPLYLRPNRIGEIEEVQDWSTLVPHHGVISSSKWAQHAEYMHHQDLEPLSEQNLDFSRPLNKGSNTFMSPISSISRSLNAAGNSSCDGIMMNDDLLACLFIRDLNKRLHGYPREQKIWLKQKLQQYIQNYRSKWMQQSYELEMTNRALKSELYYMEIELHKIKQERDYYKRRYEFMYGPGGGLDGPHSSEQSNHSSEGLQYWRQTRDVWSSTRTAAIVKTGTSRLQFNGVSNI